MKMKELIINFAFSTNLEKCCCTDSEISKFG
jgi:hypothetical protein